MNVPGMLYAQGNYSFNIFSEVLLHAVKFATIHSNYLKFCGVLDKIKPDLILTDSEPNAFLYAHRRSIPVIALTNVITTLNYYACLPAIVRNSSLGLQRLMLGQLVRFMRRRASVFVEPSIVSEKMDAGGVIYSDVIARETPEKTKKANIGKDFFYVSIGSQYEAELLKYLKLSLPKFKDNYFVIASKTAVKKEQGRNFEVLPFVENPFPYMKACKGIIAPAGHTIISEALVYKKPILVVPMKNHIEQQVNAHLVEKQGFGVACRSPEQLERSMQRFFSGLSGFQGNVNKTDFEGKGAEQVAGIVSSLIDKSV